MSSLLSSLLTMVSHPYEAHAISSNLSSSPDITARCETSQSISVLLIFSSWNSEEKNEWKRDWWRRESRERWEYVSFKVFRLMLIMIKKLIHFFVQWKYSIQNIESWSIWSTRSCSLISDSSSRPHRKHHNKAYRTHFNHFQDSKSLNSLRN